MKLSHLFNNEKNLIRFEFVAGIVFAIGAVTLGSSVYTKATDGLSLSKVLASHSMYCVEQKIACE